MNWIAEYYQAIRDGSVVVGKWVRLWYERIIKGLDKGEYSFNAKKANKAIRFVENFCRHHEGRLAPQLIKLELWQKALLSVLFGIMDDQGNRQFREAFVVIARKNGKTLLAAAIAAYMTFLDGEYGARIYFSAPKLQQSTLCYDAFYQMIQKEPELASLSTKRRFDVYVKSTNTSAQPLAFSAKKSDGLNPSLCVCDEIASWAGDTGLKNYEVLKSALGARTQPLILSISTAGYCNESIYDELMKRATSVINGASSETRLAPFLYIIDDPAKWNDINELRKSNPNLGVSVTYDYLIEEAAVAEGSLSKRGEFLTKYCNVKQNSTQAWFEYKTIDACCKSGLTLEDFRGSYCVGGIDLSQTTDLTACCVVIEKDGKLYSFSQFFMPQSRLELAQAEDGLPYGLYAKQGFLTISGENYIDYHDCFNWFVKLVQEYEIFPLQIGYDRYSAQYLVEEMKAFGFHMDDVYQGTNLTPVIRELEGIVKDGNIDFGRNNLMKACMLNSALKYEDQAQKVRLVKVGKRTRIDGCAALLDAMCVRQKWFSEIGHQLRNED